jgi:hypothetical protein
VVVDINAFTIQNIFEQQYGLPADGTIALLNVGAAVSSLNIVAKGVSAFTREITNAGNAITEEIRKALSCSYEQAEAYKHGRRPTQIVPQEVMQIINQACQGLAGEIQRSLDFYLATSGEQEIGRIYVSGGSAYLAPLVQAIEKRARVPVQLFDPMANLTVDAKTVNEPSCAPWRADGRRARARFAATRRSGNGPRKPPPREAPAPAGKRAEPTSQLWLLGVLGAFVSSIVVCLFIPEVKQDELASIVAENANVQGRSTTSSGRSPTTRDQGKLKELRDREEAIQKLQAARTGPTSTLLELAHVLTPGRGPDATATSSSS